MMRAGAPAVIRSMSRVVSRKGARWFTAQVSSSPSWVRRRELLTAPALLASTSILGWLARISAASLRIEACELRSAKRTSTSVPATARGRDLGHGGRGPGFAAGHDREQSASVGQLARRRQPDPARGAGDDHPLAGNPTPFLHDRLPGCGSAAGARAHGTVRAYALSSP